MMAKVFIYIFLFILFSCSQENEDTTQDISFGSNETLDIVTWNIENFPKSDNTIDYVADFILSISPDIIALQEIQNEEAFNSLSSLLGSNWIGYYPSGDYSTLAYLINQNTIQVNETLIILEDQNYYFAYRPPYVLQVTFNNQEYVIIDIHFKCCGDGIINYDDFSDEEYRRFMSANLLKEYIDIYLNNDNVIVLGDFNDELTDLDDNIFLYFLNDSLNYYFTDIDIAYGSTLDWSFPSWPSHLDHILITNELFNFNYYVETLKLDDYMVGGWGKYESDISDHRPVGISIPTND